MFDMSSSRVPEPSGFLTQLQRIVAEAGGEWCGVQETLDTPLLMFTSPRTGRTLAVKLSHLAVESGDFSSLAETIRKRIAESDADFANRRVSVKASTLQRLSLQASMLAAEIDKVYKGETK